MNSAAGYNQCREVERVTYRTILSRNEIVVNEPQLLWSTSYLPFASALHGGELNTKGSLESP